MSLEISGLRRLGVRMADVYAGRAQNFVATRCVASESILPFVTRNDDESLENGFGCERNDARLKSSFRSCRSIFTGEVEGPLHCPRELVDGINLKQALDHEGMFSIIIPSRSLRVLPGHSLSAHQKRFHPPGI